LAFEIIDVTFWNLSQWAKSLEKQFECRINKKRTPSNCFFQRFCPLGYSIYYTRALSGLSMRIASLMGISAMGILSCFWSNFF